jgi:hypothetical protein
MSTVVLPTYVGIVPEVEENPSTVNVRAFPSGISTVTWLALSGISMFWSRARSASENPGPVTVRLKRTTLAGMAWAYATRTSKRLAR